MRIFICVLLSIFILNSCDDGDVAVQDISFESIVGANCDKTVYKIKGNEILFFKISEYAKAFEADQTVEKVPRTYTINENNPVTYRVYSGAVTLANVCTAGTATPSLVEEWTATGGTIEITSTISKNNSTATTENTNAEEIDGYNFLIIFKNITFKKPSGEQFYEDFRFGNFKPQFDKLNFSTFIEQDIFKCTNPNNKNITGRNNFKSMISFDNSGVDDIIKNEATTVGNPRVATISTTNNLYYRLFKDNLNVADSECKKIYSSDEYLQEWKATAGSVQVETSDNSGTFIHKIYLVGVKFKKGNSEFLLGDKFYLGKL